MKKYLILFSLLCTVLFVHVSCMSNPSDLPDIEGYGGFIELGWQAIAQGEHLHAYEYFQQAIAVDLTKPEGFLGAGVACIFLENHIQLADAFFQSAIMKDYGSSVVTLYEDETQVQDTMWTVFECIDSDLPEDSLEFWLSLTSDSGEVWVGQQIYNYLFINDLSTDLEFRFSALQSNAFACTDLFNVQSGEFYGGDSTSSDFIYVTIPLHVLNIGTFQGYYTWIMVNQNITYDYATFNSSSSGGQITQDAIASRVMLQEVMGDSGSLLQAVACASGLVQIAPDYKFGEGNLLRESAFDINIIDVAASAASLSFLNEKYINAWYLCKQVGFGHDLNPFSENFLLDLLNLFNEMGG